MTPDELAKSGLMIKPLVWSLDHRGDWWAWPYRIRRIEGYYIVYGWPSGTNPYETTEAAKAAAQADYEARIIAALECVADPILAAEARGMERSAEIMDRRHAEFMGGKGRNPADYTSAYTMSAAAIRAAAKEIKP